MVKVPARVADRLDRGMRRIVLGDLSPCGLEPLVGHLGVLDERGVPLQPDGDEAAPGLRFVGFVPVPGQIRRISADARRVAREIARGGGAPVDARRRRALSSS